MAEYPAQIRLIKSTGVTINGTLWYIESAHNKNDIKLSSESLGSGLYLYRAVINNINSKLIGFQSDFLEAGDVLIYINDNTKPILIGQTGVYLLDTKDIDIIKKVQIDITLLSATNKGMFIMDYMYEKGE